MRRNVVNFNKPTQNHKPASELPRPTIKGERLKQLAVSDTGFIFDPMTGQSFTVNGTGKLVIDSLKQNQSAEEAAEQLAAACQKPYELALSCVEAFIMQLNRYL